MTRTASLVVAASVPLVAAAFWPLYLSRPFASVDRYTHLHAAAGSLWLLLLIAQPAAIHVRRIALHRLLGRVSHLAAALFAASSLLLSHHRLTSMDADRFAAEGFGHYLPFYATVAFALAYGLGLWFRRIPAVHGRFMLCTALPLVDPVLGRLLAFYLPPLPNLWFYQVVTFGVATAIAAGLVFSYRGSGVARRALRVYFAVLCALHVGWFVVAPTGPWLALVAWFRSLPLS